jgi:hypothetical protein
VITPGSLLTQATAQESDHPDMSQQGHGGEASAHAATRAWRHSVRSCRNERTALPNCASRNARFEATSWELVGPVLGGPPVRQCGHSPVVDEEDETAVVTRSISNGPNRRANGDARRRKGLIHNPIICHHWPLTRRAAAPHS